MDTDFYITCQRSLANLAQSGEIDNVIFAQLVSPLWKVTLDGPPNIHPAGHLNIVPLTIFKSNGLDMIKPL
jgi:hypothetical protein